MPTLEELFPVVLMERPLRFSSTEVNPANIIRAELARVAGVHQQQVDQLLVSLAVTWFQLAHVAQDAAAQQGALQSFNERLDIMRANLQEVLEEHRVDVCDLTGQPFASQLQESVDVRGHRLNTELSEPRVWHMEQPIVRRGGRLLMRGVVILEIPPPRQ